MFLMTSNILFLQLLSFEIHTENTRCMGCKSAVHALRTVMRSASQARVKTLTPLESALPGIPRQMLTKTTYLLILVGLANTKWFPSSTSSLTFIPVVGIQIFYQCQSRIIRRVVIVSLLGAKVISLILSSLGYHRSWSQTVAGICTDRGQELV